MEEIIKNSRVLFEDYCCEVIKRKGIEYSPKATLSSLLTTLRENSKTLFKFPDWLVDDLFGYFKEYVLNMRFIGVILNPNSHIDSLDVKKNEALAIKNSAISIMISLTGFLK